jgi:hypothetical protein
MPARPNIHELYPAAYNSQEDSRRSSAWANPIAVRCVLPATNSRLSSAPPPSPQPQYPCAFPAPIPVMQPLKIRRPTSRILEIQTTQIHHPPPNHPSSQINGENPAHGSVGATYQDLGATIVAPDADKNLGIKTFLNGALVSDRHRHLGASNRHHRLRRDRPHRPHRHVHPHHHRVRRSDRHRRFNPRRDCLLDLTGSLLIHNPIAPQHFIQLNQKWGDSAGPPIKQNGRLKGRPFPRIIVAVLRPCIPSRPSSP